MHANGHAGCCAEPGATAQPAHAICGAAAQRLPTHPPPPNPPCTPQEQYSSAAQRLKAHRGNADSAEYAAAARATLDARLADAGIKPPATTQMDERTATDWVWVGRINERQPGTQKVIDALRREFPALAANTVWTWWGETAHKNKKNKGSRLRNQLK